MFLQHYANRKVFNNNSSIFWTTEAFFVHLHENFQETRRKNEEIKINEGKHS